MPLNKALNSESTTVVLRQLLDLCVVLGDDLRRTRVTEAQTPDPKPFSTQSPCAAAKLNPQPQTLEAPIL